MIDPILGVVQLLLADSNVQSFCSTNVYDFELPETMDALMPTQTIVVRPQGGPKNFHQLYLNETRVGLVCYGQTPNLSYQVYQAAYLAMKNLHNVVYNHTYLQSALEEAGPMAMRDPTLQWPYNYSTWLVIASDMSV